jgi:hypothetical protein
MRDGGVLGMKGGGVGRKGLTPMRGGIAQVVKPNTWRVIGDRISGDEFFLPDDDKARSLRIGEEWARRRGLQLVPSSAGVGQMHTAGSAGVSAIRQAVTHSTPRGDGSQSAASVALLNSIRDSLAHLKDALVDELRDSTDIAHGDANMTGRSFRAMADAMVAAAMARSDAVASGARTRSRLGMHANG